MVNVLMSKNAAWLHNGLKTRLGAHEVGVVRDVNRLPDKRILIFQSFEDYAKAEIEDGVLPVVCDFPFKYEGKMNFLDSEEFSFIRDLEDFGIKENFLSNFKPVQGKVIKIKKLTDKVLSTFKPSSVIDKIHTYVYSATTNKNRRAVRALFSDFILFDVFTEEEARKRLKDLKVKAKDEDTNKLLDSIFEYMKKPIGRRFSKACRWALEEEQNGGLPHDKVAKKSGVDKFDVKTVLLNCSR